MHSDTQRSPHASSSGTHTRTPVRPCFTFRAAVFVFRPTSRVHQARRRGGRSGQASRPGGPSILSLLARALLRRTAITSRSPLLIISIVVIAALQHLGVAEARRVALLARAAPRDLHVGVGSCGGGGRGGGGGAEASLDAWVALDDLELRRAQLACRDAQARAQLGTVPRVPGRKVRCVYVACSARRDASHGAR